jgi:ribosomal protein L2
MNLIKKKKWDSHPCNTLGASVQHILYGPKRAAHIMLTIQKGEEKEGLRCFWWND